MKNVLPKKNRVQKKKYKNKIFLFDLNCSKNQLNQINELRRRELTEFYEFIQPRQQEANEIRKQQREEFKVKVVFKQIKIIEIFFI